jgi:hypothetical protein
VYLVPGDASSLLEDLLEDFPIYTGGRNFCFGLTVSQFEYWMVIKLLLFPSPWSFSVSESSVLIQELTYKLIPQASPLLEHGYE